MDNKYGTMLQNTPIRHVFYKLPSAESDIRNQLMSLSKVNIHNYFILGTFEMIQKVLKVGSSQNMNANKYGWLAMTKDSEAIMKCEDCRTDMHVIYMHPTQSTMNTNNSGREGQMTLDDIREHFGLEVKPEVDIAFYFDVGLLALHAVR